MSIACLHLTVVNNLANGFTHPPEGLSQLEMKQGDRQTVSDNLHLIIHTLQSWCKSSQELLKKMGGVLVARLTNKREPVASSLFGFVLGDIP